MTQVSGHQVNNNPLLHGLPVFLSTYLTNSVPGTVKKTETHYDYTLSDDELTIAIRVVGFDGTEKTTSETTSLYSGLSLRETDSDGVMELRAYDTLGRLVSHVLAAGSDYENTEIHAYRFPATADECYTETVTNEWGISTRISMDGFGQECRTEIQDDDGEKRTNEPYNGTYRETEHNYYYQRGRVITWQSYDYVDGIASIIKQECYTYDSWGQVSETQHQDGLVETTHMNPVTPVMLEGKKDKNNLPLSFVRTTYNQFNKSVQIEILHQDQREVYSQTSKSYDGYGRLTKHTILPGSSLTVDLYDDFDRPLKVTHFDGTMFNATYIDSSTDSDLTSLDALINGTTINLGTRSFDGLGRLQSSCVSNRVQTLSYNGSSEYPSTLINGRQQTIKTNYIPEIQHLQSLAYPLEYNENTMTVNSFDFTLKGDLHYPPGIKVSATDGECRFDYKWSPSGRPLQVDTRYLSNPGANTTLHHTKFTLQGKNLESEMATRTLCQAFDKDGRLTGTSDNAIQTALSYDSFGRMTTLSVSDSGALKQVTTITYDEFSREASRHIASGEHDTTISYQYDNQHRITQRKRILETGESLNECFSYDVRHRLSQWIIEPGYSPSLLPHNEQGNPITGQTFRYDPLNNLLSIVTSFPDAAQDTAVLTYDGQLLTRIEHSLTTGSNAYPPLIGLTYDDDLNLISITSSVQQSTFSYSPHNKMTGINNITCLYDVYGRLSCTGDIFHQYQGNEIFATVSSAQHRAFVRCDTIPVAEIDDSRCRILATDHQNSVIRVCDDLSDISSSYSPFGCGRTISATGFSGQIKDLISGGYPMGNGVRWYLPELAQFTSPDVLSPFSYGGINLYRYCLGDPINGEDITGYAPNNDIIMGGVGIFIGIISLLAAPFTGGTSVAIGAAMISAALGTASSALKLSAGLATNDNAKYTLKRASMGLGIASAVVGLAGTAYGIGKKLVTSTTRTYSKTFFGLRLR